MGKLKVEKPQPVIKKFWGSEQTLINNRFYCGKIMLVEGPRRACSIHFHRRKLETFYVFSGVLILEIYERKAKYGDKVPKRAGKPKQILHLSMGQLVTLPPRTPHRFYSPDPRTTVFYEFSTPDSVVDSYRIKPAGLLAK